MKRWAARAFNLDADLVDRALLLSFCLFLIISSSVIGKVARDALFLARFRAVQLPYADIASGVLIGFVVALYLKIGRHVALRGLLVGSQVFFAANCIIFWASAHYYHPVWLFPVFYVWVGMFAVLAPTQVWTLANYLLTTREAKRVFGFVAAGGILGWIFAGFVSKSAANAFGTESLLFAMTVLLVASAAVMSLAWRGQKVQLSDSEESTEGVAGTGQKDILGSIRLVLSSPYLRAIAAVICISSFVTTFTGWQFKAIAKQSFASKDLLASFFGDFYFYAGLLALAFQFLLTTRLLRRFGIGTMLFLLPAAVLIGSLGLLAFGTLTAAFLLKGSDQVLRYSIDRATVELLYLPLSARVKLQAKWFVDTVIWRFGDGLAGVAVLVFATYLHWPPQRLSWISLALIGVWLVSVAISGQQYLVVLRDSLTEHRLDPGQATTQTLDRSTSDLLASKLRASDAKEILYALGLFEIERTRTTHPVIPLLLHHPSAEVRRKAICLLSESADTSVNPQMRDLLTDPDPDVRTEAMLFLVHHAHVDPLVLLNELTDVEGFSVQSAVAAYLARPGDSQNLEAARNIFEQLLAEPTPTNQRCREEVAKLLGELPDSFDPLLARLIADPASAVTRVAISSTGKLRKDSLVPELISLLATADFAKESAEALAQYGDAVVGRLSDGIGSAGLRIEIRREIPLVLATIGTPAAAQALHENLLEPDTSLRFKIISALNKLQRSHPDIKFDQQLLETVLAAEILGHYRSYQILQALEWQSSSRDPVHSALKESLQQELERIFRLLSLLFPQLELHSVYLGLQSENKTVHDNALEFLENVLKSRLRSVLVPLLDGRVSARERADLADRLVHAKIENREQAVTALVLSDDPWLKSCGAYAIGSFGLLSLEKELDRCLEHQDPLLRETARAAKLRLVAQRKATARASS
jgi:AAA family ATP:ADP antiporter